MEISEFPNWVGSLPTWGMFFLLAVAIVKQSIPWRQQTIDSAAQIRKELQDRVAGLKKEHADCMKTMRDLQEQIYGLRRQHIQEQISLINAIIESVDAPQLKMMLKTLQTVRLTVLREPVFTFEGADDETSGT